MNTCFCVSIDRLPLSTVAAIEFVGPIALAMIGARIGRNFAAVGAAAGAVYLLTGATYALYVALLPATAAVIGVIVLHQLPSSPDTAGIALVMLGVLLHRPDRTNNARAHAAGNTGRQASGGSLASTSPWTALAADGPDPEGGAR